jgi:hypothetical protein
MLTRTQDGMIVHVRFTERNAPGAVYGSEPPIPLLAPSGAPLPLQVNAGESYHLRTSSRLEAQQIRQLDPVDPESLCWRAEPQQVQL